MSTEPEPSDELPEALRAFLAELPPTARPKVAHEDGQWRIRLGPMKRPVEVGRLLTETRVAIDVDLARQASDGARSLTIKTVPAGERLHVHVTKIGNNTQLRFSDLHGHVDVDTTDQKATVDLTKSCDGTARFGPGSFVVNVAEGASVELAAGSATHLELDGRVSKLSITERCTVKPSTERIGEIVVPRDGASIEIVGGTLAADSIVAVGDPAELTLTAADARRSTSSNQGLKVDVKKITGVTLRSDTKPINLTVTSYAHGLVVCGDVNVTLKSGSADGLASLGRSTLMIGKSAVATDVTGQWTLATIAHAHILGAEQGFDISSIEATTPGRNNPTALVEGAVLIGFRLPGRRRRRQLLAALGSTYHLDPDARGLPGGGPEYNERRPWRWKLDPDRMKELPADAEFVRELARLSREKGAPGSTRTRIAWCAYRLRHLASSSWWERRALDGYRMLGYGERPGPAFLTWLVLAFITTPLVLAASHGLALDLSPSGLWTFMVGAFDQALGPVGALLDTGSADGSKWEYALRALIAIPLVTGALALRNYVKHGGR